MVGEVFGRRADTFYTFEPLFARAMWSYYKTNTTTCNLLKNKWYTTSPKLTKFAVALRSRCGCVATVAVALRFL